MNATPKLNEAAEGGSSPVPCSPSYSARFRLGQDVVEIRVPTGEMGNPHCWHGLDMDAAKRLRDELCKSIDTLEAFQNLRKEIPENAKHIDRHE